MRRLNHNFKKGMAFVLSLAMVAGLVLVPIVSLFTKKPDKKWVEATFACYDRKIEVPVRQSLDE